MRSRHQIKGWKLTEGLFVIEFALFLWLFLIVILAANQSSLRQKCVIIKDGTSGKGIPNIFMNHLNLNPQTFQARKSIPTLPQVIQEHVHRQWPILTGGANREPNPDSQIGKMGNTLLFRWNCQRPGDL